MVIDISEVCDIDVINYKENQTEQEIEKSNFQRIALILSVKNFLHNVSII
jgi:hypothetical protein